MTGDRVDPRTASGEHRDRLPIQAEDDRSSQLRISAIPLPASPSEYALVWYPSPDRPSTRCDPRVTGSSKSGLGERLRVDSFREFGERRRDVAQAAGVTLVADEVKRQSLPELTRVTCRVAW